MADGDKLRELAAWYRGFAERAGNPTIWDLRLRTAQDLEAEADRRGRRAMQSAEELRAEARRLMETVKDISDPRLKQELASRALALSQRAEAMTNWLDHPEILHTNIIRYRSMLAAGISDPDQRKILEEMIADAEEMLENSSKGK
jgi:hypothetical protein